MVEILSVPIGDLCQPGEVGLQESDLLDRLTMQGIVEADSATEKVRLVSLGCMCAPKLSFKKIGRGAETLPFDWIRTRIEGLLHFLVNDFQGFYDWKTKQRVPNGMTIYRGYYHSFWHDKPFEEAMRERYDRRILRFKEIDANTDPVLFVRSCAESAELAKAPELLGVLKSQFGSHACLLMILDFQQTAQGAALVAGHPNLMIYYLNGSVHEGGDGAPYCDAINVGLSWAIGSPIQAMEFDGIQTIVDCADYTVWGMTGLYDVPAFEDEISYTPEDQRLEVFLEDNCPIAQEAVPEVAKSPTSLSPLDSHVISNEHIRVIDSGQDLQVIDVTESVPIIEVDGDALKLEALARVQVIENVQVIDVADDVQIIEVANDFPLITVGSVDVAAGVATSQVAASDANVGARKDVESELLELLDQARSEVSDGVALVSLGCFCGPKLTFQKLGRGAESLPFDWVRTSFDGIIHFLKSDFEDFFEYKTKKVVKGSTMVMYRSRWHSFWHDNPDSEEMRVKYARRIQRLKNLNACGKQLLFVRAISSMDELARADELLAVLCDKIGLEICLLLVADFQASTLGAIMVENYDNLLVYFQGSQDRGDDPSAPFSKPIQLGLNWVKGEPVEAGCVADLALLRQLANSINTVELAHFGEYEAFEPSTPRRAPSNTQRTDVVGVNSSAEPQSPIKPCCQDDEKESVPTPVACVATVVGSVQPCLGSKKVVAERSSCLNGLRRLLSPEKAATGK